MFLLLILLNVLAVIYNLFLKQNISSFETCLPKGWIIGMIWFLILLLLFIKYYFKSKDKRNRKQTIHIRMILYICLYYQLVAFFLDSTFIPYFILLLTILFYFTIFGKKVFSFNTITFSEHLENMTFYPLLLWMTFVTTAVFVCKD
jgi:hypothetical protein